MMHKAGLLLVATMVALSGCFGFLAPAKDHAVSRTPLDEDGWNRDGLFTVQVREPEPVTVVIKGTATDGRAIQASGLSSLTLPPVELTIPDGTWTVRYDIDGTKWETFKDVRFDGTPPTVTGLQTLGVAQGGSYVIGQGAQVEPGADVRVLDQDTGVLVGTGLPTQVSGLADGVHAFDVVVTDEAGNEFTEQVHVRAGAAVQLPDGQHTLGLVARYELTALVWDLTTLSSWATPAQARSATGGTWLGAGRAVEPDDGAVTDVVGQVVTPAMTTGEAAFELYKWMSDHLEYDRSRLEASTLLTPSQVLLDAEDPRDDTAEGEGDGTGLARDGSGNGVAGGVCRDLAATYVSLLRAAGVPARLVTGYLGGEVDGFHAWVEFYGGEGHGPSPWVPVDISSVGSTGEPGEQGYDVSVALQAFGLRHTDMLPLRVVSSAQEQGPWSAAVSIATRYPEDSEPQVDLAKTLPDAYNVETKGTLCVNTQTLERQVISARRVNDCPRTATAGFTEFVRTATHVLDYGADIAQAAPGTTVTLTLAYPDSAAVSPGTVEQATYGDAFTKDPEKGVTVAVWDK